MNFRPVELMMDRVQRHGDDFDSVLFTEYLYAGELIAKLNVAAGGVSKSCWRGGLKRAAA